MPADGRPRCSRNCPDRNGPRQPAEVLAVPYQRLLDHLLHAVRGTQAALLLDAQGELVVEAGTRDVRHRLIGAYQGIGLAITELDLTRCAIGSRGALALAANRSISKLDLSCNRIGNAAAMALAANPAITSLSLMSCGLNEQTKLAIRNLGTHFELLEL